MDDKSVDSLTNLLRGHGADIRNSSVRAKAANQERLNNGNVPEKVLRRLLRMKISWAQTVVVLIGPQTHKSDWVDYEIQEANRQGKRIVGVYDRGCTDATVPPALEKYASSIIGWNGKSILSALDDESNRFENPDGSERTAPHESARQRC